MPAKIIDGRKISSKYLEEAKSYIKKNKIRPKLSTILTTGDPASITYTNIKRKTCESIGIEVIINKISSDEKSILATIDRFNKDTSVNGVLVQLPLPRGINTQKIIEHIRPEKDVDGIHPLNIGKLAYGDEKIPTCTSYGIIKMLEYEDVVLEGSNVVIVGRSLHIGKPLYSMLYNRNATVTMCHSKTKNLKNLTKTSDILIVSVGVPNFIDASWIKDGAVVIDVGINKIDKKIIGDVNFDSVKKKASYVTPVPGGVGPMTIAMLAMNTLNAYKIQNRLVD